MISIDHCSSYPSELWSANELIPNSSITVVDHSLLDQIHQIRNTGSFQTIRKVVGDEKLRAFLLELYPTYTITELETILGVPDSTLEYWFKQLNIPFSAHHASNLTFPANFNAQKTLLEGEKAATYSAIEITPDLAYLIGFALGDGSIQKYMVEVFNQDRTLRSHLLPILKKYGSVTEDWRSNGLWRLRLSSVKIANLIKDRKVIRDDTLNYILSTDELAQQFIAAFWDAEGTVRKQDNSYHLYLYNTNKELLDKIGTYLKSKGINYSVHSRFDNHRIYFLEGRKVETKKPIHRFCVPKQHYSKWVNLIGIHMKHTKKSTIISELKSTYGGGKQYE